MLITFNSLNTFYICVWSYMCFFFFFFKFIHRHGLRYEEIPSDTVWSIFTVMWCGHKNLAFYYAVELASALTKCSRLSEVVYVYTCECVCVCVCECMYMCVCDYILIYIISFNSISIRIIICINIKCQI